MTNHRQKGLPPRQGGQVLLIVLLVTVVALTLGLGAISQSITDIKISEEEAESARAFNLAEAGIEQALKSLTSGGWEEGDARYDVEVVEQSGFTTAYPVEEGEVVQLVVDGDNDVDISWDSGAALELIILIDSGTGYVVERHVYDDSRDIPESEDPDPDNTVSLTLPPQAQLLRLRPLLNSSSFNVSGTLPNQQYLITATGQTGSGVTRKIEVTREIVPSLPSVFDYALFSGGSI